MAIVLTIYGRSDDLIEIESSDEEKFPAEEFNVLGGQSSDSWLLAVSDGTVLRVRFDEDGIWRFSPTVIGSSLTRIDQGQDDRQHSDRVIMCGENLHWVVLVFGSAIARSTNS